MTTDCGLLVRTAKRFYSHIWTRRSVIVVVVVVLGRIIRAVAACAGARLNIYNRNRVEELGCPEE